MLTFKWRNNRLLKNKYDFLDLGCKAGGSIEWCMHHYGGKGLGVDYSKNNVKKARKNGYDVIYANVLDIDFPANSFRYVSMMDFLEHLPDEESVKIVLKKCKKWSREFILIHHPSFEYVNYLKQHSLKIDWTDGYGHTCPLTIKDFKRIFKELSIKNYKIEETKIIKDSMDSHIIPIDAPHNTHFYSKELGPKKKIKFEKKIFSRVEIIAQVD